MKSWKTFRESLKKGLSEMTAIAKPPPEEFPNITRTNPPPLAFDLTETIDAETAALEPAVPEAHETEEVSPLPEPYTPLVGSEAQPISQDSSRMTSGNITSRTITDIAVEYESSVNELEDMFTGTEAYFQKWLKEHEPHLRNRAALDRRAEMEAAANKVAHLESEMASAATALSRRSSAVRSKIAS